MLKKTIMGLLFILIILSLQFNVFAFNHKLKKDWYNEAITGVKKEDVTSITIEDSGYDKSKLTTYWALDKDGLIAYLDGETDIVISIPEGNTLETGVDASGIFSFFVFNKETDYETGDDGIEIKGLEPPDEGYQINNYSKYISKLESINNLYLLNTYSTENFNNMFMGLKELTNLDLSSMHTQSATSMNAMFMGCEKLKQIDISSFDTSNVTSMDSMFKDCKKLENVNTAGLKTSQLESMARMFEDCDSLTSISLNQLDTSSVNDMTEIFNNCDNLQFVYLDKINTKEVRKCESMFYKCENLKYIDLIKFNTSCLNICRHMFCGCKSLEAIDLSSFKFNGNVDTEYMLLDMDKLKAIIISESMCDKIKETRLVGKWKNVQNNQIYDFSWDSKDKPIPGGYVKVN